MLKTTIGMPVFNEEAHIERAIRSAVQQCDRLVISDNASTDKTLVICKELSREFDNIEVFAQKNNFGSMANFKFVLDQCTTPYFMWLGGHDLVPDGYIETLSSILDRNHDVVLAYGDSQHVDTLGHDVSMYRYRYGGELCDDEVTARLLALLRYLSDCSLFYGVMRTESIRSVWFDDIFTGTDRFMLLKLAALGKLQHAPETHFIIRDAHPNDQFKAYMTRLIGQRVLANHELGDVSQVSLTRNHREMAQRSFELVCTASQGRGVKGAWVRCEAWVYLVVRYAPFGKSLAARCMGYVVSKVGRSVRGVRRSVVRLVRS